MAIFKRLRSRLKRLASKIPLSSQPPPPSLFSSVFSTPFSSPELLPSSPNRTPTPDLIATSTAYHAIMAEITRLEAAGADIGNLGPLVDILQMEKHAGEQRYLVRRGEEVREREKEKERHVAVERRLGERIVELEREVVGMREVLEMRNARVERLEEKVARRDRKVGELRERLGRR